MTIIFNDTLGAYGGGQTLMLRVCIWMHQHGHKTIIFCSSDNNIEIVEKLKKNQTTIECFNLFNYKEMRQKLLLYLACDEIKVVYLSWNYYLDIEVTKKIYNLKFDNFLYVIHHETFKKGIGFRSNFMRNYSIRKYSGIFQRMNKNDAILMMDEIYQEEGEKYLNTKLKPAPTMIRLPVFCNDNIDVERVIKSGYRSRIVMTAARAEFPFKGYMLGLIEDFVELKKKYKDIQLEIVSDGDDIEELLDKIYSVSEDIRKDIILHRWLDYEVLKEETENCFLYIGTGTTVLDAALEYKPSIPVVYGIYQNYADATLSEKPEAIFPPLNCTNRAYNIMDTLLSYSFEEYYSHCIKSYEAVKEIYNIDVQMPKLLSCENKKKASVLKMTECYRHILNNKVNELRYRDKNKLDYRKLVLEKTNI